MARAPWVRLCSPDLFPQVPFSSRWRRREVQLCSTPVNVGIRWQSRFCLARKHNNITTINQIWSVSCSLLLSSSVTLSSEGFSFTLFFEPFSLAAFSKKHECHHLASCWAAGGSWRDWAPHIGCSVFPAWSPQTQAFCFPCFQHFQD